MKKQPNPHLLTRSTLAFALAIAIWSPLPTRAAEPMHMHEMSDAKMMEQCQEMKHQKMKLNADIKVQDVQLAEQLAAMNRAPKDQKIDLMAAVLNHLVNERIVLDARKIKMEDAMMQHMVRHMEMGMASMSSCPMMKGMKDMDDKEDGDHKEHDHEEK